MSGVGGGALFNLICPGHADELSSAFKPVLVEVACNPPAVHKKSQCTFLDGAHEAECHITRKFNTHAAAQSRAGTSRTGKIRRLSMAP